MLEMMQRGFGWRMGPGAGIWVCLLIVIGGCSGGAEKERAPRAQTWAELRQVRQGVRVTFPDETERAPYPRERLVDGARITVDAGGLAWLRRDGGARVLVGGDSELVLEKERIELVKGRGFVDAPPGTATEIGTPAGVLTFDDVRVALDVGQSTRAYVLRGALRGPSGEQAKSGEALVLTTGKPARIEAVKVFSDWTGGLATTEPMAEPAPFGVGTVGARDPGMSGAPRFALAIQRLSVRVKIDGDFATTEVDQRFFNASSGTVEGIYRFRTPESASIQRFGVDRGERLVWGRVKESAAAAEQYQSNVFAGSTEDPALLEWDGVGAYRARLYPIGPGESRRVVVRYTEWLPRTGLNGERRAYVYPMAASGAEGSLPRIEQWSLAVDLASANAKEVRSGMGARLRGQELLVSRHDFVPRADFTVELFDDGTKQLQAYRARHAVDALVLPPDDRARASQEGDKELDYLIVPVRPQDLPEQEPGVDLAIVVDASAANDSGAMALAKTTTTALLSHLGERDRAVVFAGAETLRPVLEDAKPQKFDRASVRRIGVSLSALERGGATDLGTMLTEAARSLDPKRRGAVVYIGDGRPTVGELHVAEIDARLASLPRPVRVFGLMMGGDDNLAGMSSLARGGFARRIEDAHGAAETALDLLEHAERPAWLSVKVDLGPGVERVLPKKDTSLVLGETTYVIARVVGDVPQRIALRGNDGTTREHTLNVVSLDDGGDLRRRWAGLRLRELLEEGAGRAALVDLGMRHGIVTPVTSLYVPTQRELAQEQPAPEETDPLPAEEDLDNKEGGSGTRAKGEEGRMGRDPNTSAKRRYAVEGPKSNTARAEALKDAAEFGMVGVLNSGASGDPTAAAGNTWGDDASAFGAGGLGLSGIAQGGGGKGDAIGLGNIGTLGHGAGTGTGAGFGRGQGFGSGHGRLGGSHRSTAPQVKVLESTVEPASLPPEVIGRIVRQNLGRFRLCYEGGLSRNPNLQGNAALVLSIDASGSVSRVTRGGSDLPDAQVLTCLQRALSGLSFPAPEGGPMKVTQRLSFHPGGGEPLTEPKDASSVTVRVDVLPRMPRYCSAAANQSLYERIVLWRERLGQVQNSPSLVHEVYRRALGQCEASTWRERRLLLTLMLDALPVIRDQIALWRMLERDRIAQDAFYRGVVARVRTGDQRRDLNAALGVLSVDPGRLERVVKTANPTERVKQLRALRVEFPRDFRLALRLVEALEDADDVISAEALAESLRARPDADTQVRSAVGEFYLRLATKTPKQKAALTARAKRAFGEIVEFAPDDPVLRRLLGDLLRAHGWYSDARRQYETLALLAPDDPSVPLLLALAQQGEGQLEAAVRFTEKGVSAGAPDASQGPAATARALARVFLAWGRLTAREQKASAELAALVARAQSFAASAREPTSTGPRATLTWSHPELHPLLFAGPTGALFPAPEGDVTLGISTVRLADSKDSVLEVRVEADAVEHVARLGAEIVLTVVVDELGKNERVVRVPARFERGGPPVLRFVVSASGEVSRG